MKNATTIRRRISMSPLRLGPLLLLPLLSACGVQGATEGVADEREESPGAVGSPQEADPRQTVGEEDHQEGEAAEGEDHLGEIHLGTEQAESFGVRVEALQAGSARSTLSRPVTLLLNPDRKALVGPRLEAKVVRVTADLGDRVRAGDTLAILSSVELGRAKSGFLTARARFHTAETTYRREQTLYEREISSEAELLEAEARFREGRAELNAAREALRLYGLTLEEIEGVEAGSQVPLVLSPPEPRRWAGTAP
ncbi:MAG: efflux RND transporter periplasmic adaptor subunit [Gemmatimonadota bacterium]|nr:efflux RND transporter periplasmic adaptor subunit [Gemmatimonadota bacterium]